MRRPVAADDALEFPAPARRAVGYIRVSTEEQAEGGMSLDTQEAALRRAAAQEGFELVEILRDEGISAFKNLKRPGFNTMMKRLAEFDVVMVWKLDRFGRKTKNILQGIEEITDLGKRFYSVLETLDTSTPFGRFALTNMAALAQLESETTQTRVLPNIKASVERGLHHGRPNYGYKITTMRVQEVMQPDPKAAGIVRRVFGEYASGKPFLQIVRGLNQDGIPSRKAGAKWHISTIKQILKSPVYIGMVQHGPSNLLIKGLHEPLIDMDTWEAVQRRIKRSTKIHARARQASLAPILRCGLCGHRIGACAKVREQRYFCRDATVNPAIHEPLTISQPVLHHYIWGVVDLLLTPRADMQLAIQWSQHNKPPDSRVARLREEREQLEEEIGYNLTQARMAKLPHKILAKQNAPLQERLAEVEAEVEALAIEEPRETIPELRAKMQSAREAGFEQQRDYLGQLFSQIEVGREYICFHFHEEGIPPVKIKRHPTRGLKAQYRSSLPIERIP